MGNHPVVVRFWVIVILQLVITNIVVALMHIFRNINIIVIVFATIFFKIVLTGFRLKFIFLKFVFCTFFSLLKRRVLLHFFLDALIEDRSRNLQQFHQLNLLGR